MKPSFGGRTVTCADPIIDGQPDKLEKRLLYIGSKFYGQAERAISNGQLNISLCFHIRPIDVIVYHGPS